jgi:hypothetical protein
MRCEAQLWAGRGSVVWRVWHSVGVRLLRVVERRRHSTRVIGLTISIAYIDGFSMNEVLLR